MGAGKTLIILMPLVLAIVWYELVYEVVSGAYLDEQFHIQQAQHYLSGRWHVWDPKITTPPGLYIASWLIAKGGSSLGMGDMVAEEGRDLRIVNLICVVALAKVLLAIREKLDENAGQGEGSLENSVFQRRHVVANMLLFPVMFFFYGLYYTDILSVLTVMTTYLLHLRGDSYLMILSGLCSLAVRQTNIFWVGVFLAALEVKRLSPGRLQPFSPMTISKIITRSFSNGQVYDPLIGEASFEDYVLTSFSYIAAVSMNLTNLMFGLWPYILIIALFVQFVIWNGGVVLGDRGNHIATVHFAQMLYVWPYITFFSLPLLYKYLLQRLVPNQFLPRTVQSWSSQTFRPRILVAIPTVAIMLAVVHYNTVIHPFTLADNRHFVFYVFRILNQHEIIRYIVVPVYFTAAWAVLLLPADLQLANCTTTRSVEKEDKSAVEISKPQYASIAQGLRVSWMLAWIGATALSLCTAPLVEPRYCIVPWLIWRLHLPSIYQSLKEPGKAGSGREEKNQASYNLSLWLETAWFSLINVVVGYVFLFRPFEWKQEAGVKQRFMW